MEYIFDFNQTIADVSATIGEQKGSRSGSRYLKASGSMSLARIIDGGVAPPRVAVLYICQVVAHWPKEERLTEAFEMVKY